MATTINNPWLAGRANYHLGELARRRGITKLGLGTRSELAAEATRRGL